MTDAEMTQLEAMIDRGGLKTVLDAISGICDAKAEHILTNRQDKALAGQWAAAAARIETTAGLASIANVSR
jgi:hypothetical protein